MNYESDAHNRLSYGPTVANPLILYCFSKGGEESKSAKRPDCSKTVVLQFEHTYLKPAIAVEHALQTPQRERCFPAGTERQIVAKPPISGRHRVDCGPEPGRSVARF